MEFWGIEVKAGQTIKCNPATDGKLLHLSQASLGEIKKDRGSDSIPLSVKVGDQKFVIGTLSSEKFPQMPFDLIFEREFELSHGSKTESVYFCGYYTTTFDDDEPEEFTDTDSDEENAHFVKENGTKDVEDKKQEPGDIKVNVFKSEFSNDKSLASITESKKSSDTSDDDESEEEDSDDEMATFESEDESDDESSDEDAAAQKKVETGKKKPIESVAKVSTSEKKAKLAIQSDKKTGNNDVEDKKQKPATKVNAIKSEDAKSLASITETKKSSDTSDDESEEEDSDDEMAMFESEDESDDESSDEDATALKKVGGIGKKRPVETVAKIPTSKKKAKLAIQSDQKSGTEGKKGSHKATPKSGGQVICKSCSKTFNSEFALQSHAKAKHSASK